MTDPYRDTPTVVTKAITEHGGLNPYGRPYWRVILAHNHTLQKHGVWCDWGDGAVEQFTLDGARLRHNEVHPKSVVEETRETPIWPKAQGWILERWFPAEVWAREGDDRFTEGEYYLIAPTVDPDGKPVYWEQMPEIFDLTQAISNWEREYLNRPTDFDMAYAMFVAEEQAEEDRQNQKSREELEYFYRHEVVPLWKSLSLDAQKVRNQTAEAAGIKGHIGAE